MIVVRMFGFVTPGIIRVNISCVYIDSTNEIFLIVNDFNFPNLLCMPNSEFEGPVPKFPYDAKTTNFLSFTNIYQRMLDLGGRSLLCSTLLLDDLICMLFIPRAVCQFNLA